MTDTLDGTATEVGTELEPQPAVATALTIAPQVKATDLVERLDTIRDAMHTAMQPDVDYGVIPGTDKPTLLKPGAEKLGVLFQLDVQLDNEKRWGPDDHLTVLSRATVYHAPTGSRLGFGEGMCSTRERKYAYRKQQRLCPDCGAAAVIKGKEEFGGGWLCWKKRDGCGAKFQDGDVRITDQPVGDVDNPDLPDTWNTVVKMAEKRARIDAILAVTGASALFTQDMEDRAPGSSDDDLPFNATDAPPALCSKEQYQAALAAFSQAQRDGLAFDDFLKHLDEIGAPASEVVGDRVAGLSPDAAEELRGWLLERTAQQETLSEDLA